MSRPDIHLQAVRQARESLMLLSLGEQPGLRDACTAAIDALNAVIVAAVAVDPFADGRWIADAEGVHKGTETLN